MAKKILAICAALVAFAALPAVASASPVLQEGGVNVATGSGITATNSGPVVFKSSLGNVTCSNSVMHGTLVTNSGKLIEGTITSASWTGANGAPCESWAGDTTVTPVLTSTESTKHHWCIKTTSTTEDKWQLRGGGCAQAEGTLAFTLDFPGFSCKFSRAANLGGVTGTYETGKTPAPLKSTATEFLLIEGGFLCPSKGTLEPATYTLETIREGKAFGLTIN
jgi:hypothetical protein